MTLPVSGAISFNAINVELGQAGATSANINQASYRALAGIPSGTISLASFYGKANTFPFNLTSGSNLNLRTQALAAGWNGTTKVVATIPASNYIQSSSVGSYALTIDGSFPNGVELVNNGVIVGRGGNGGYGGAGSPACNCYAFANNGQTSGTNAGPALYVSVAVTINNASGIVGGGGGGGGGGNSAWTSSGGGGGGGIGGGTGGTRLGGCNYGATGGTGTATAAGAGGTTALSGGAACGSYQFIGGPGGAGGSYGAVGSYGYMDNNGSGQPYCCNASAGGAAGAATQGNVNITWSATGNRYGALN